MAILFCNSPGKLEALRISNNGHWLICVLNIDEQYYILVNIHGFNNLTQNKQLILYISDAIESLKLIYPTANVIIGGDFNMVNDECLDRYPPKCQYSSQNPTLSDLLDPWRLKHPDTKQYSWFKPNNTTKSRIDFWLISASLLSYVSDCCMSAAPLTDHSVIKWTFKPPGFCRRNKGYWKFNSSLLKCQTFCDGIKTIISDVMNDESVASSTSNWEFLKFKIREYSIHSGKTLNRSDKLSEINIIKEINSFCNKASPMDNDKQKLQILQTKLGEMYLKKAEGAYIRSRAKWIEEGERSTSYFCHLEKRRQERNSIKALIIHGHVNTDPTLIAKEIDSFYSQLYSSGYSIDDAESFFNHIKDLIPRIDGEFAKLCDADITSDELDKKL